MSKEAFDYFAGGAGDETSLEESTVAWRRHRLRPHAFPGGAVPDLSIEVLDTPVSFPVIVAPTAWQQLAHPAGEVETAAGVSAAGGLMVVATRSTMVIEEIAGALSGPWWYQVYVVNERRITEELVRRAVGLGARALLLTADTPYLGFKRRQNVPPVSIEQHLANFGAHLGSGTVAEDVAHSIDQDASISFETIAWLRDLAGVPVLVKGVLRGDDAAACLDAGAAGVVVSNHGGRQLDRAIAPAVALPEVVAAVEGRGPVPRRRRDSQRDRCARGPRTGGDRDHGRTAGAVGARRPGRHRGPAASPGLSRRAGPRHGPRRRFHGRANRQRPRGLTRFVAAGIVDCRPHVFPDL